MTVAQVTGDGTVTAPAGVEDGISCGFGGTDCAEEYSEGTTVQLSAIPEAGWVFDSWGGDADCLDGVVDMSADVSCSASFTETWHLTVVASGAGSGTISLNLSSDTIPCGLQCSEDIAVGAAVTIVPLPDASSVFSGFEGDPECLPDGFVDPDEAVRDLSCTVRFEPTGIFADDFETGDTSEWSSSIP